MSAQTNPQQQTFEQFAFMWDDLAGWSAGFANGVVTAFEEGGSSALERLTAVRHQYQLAISAAIARRDAALAAADVIAEGVWRSAADEMSRVAFLLADEAQDAATRLATFQVAINDGLRTIGRYAGPVFDVYGVADAIRAGDGNKAGEAVLAIGLGAGIGAAVVGVSNFFGIAATWTAFAGGTGAVVGAVSAKYLNPYTTRPVFDWMGTYLPDSWWQNLESLTFGAGAARLDPSGSVYASMLLHRIDNKVQLSELGHLFDVAASARQGRESVALINELGQLFQPARPPLSDDATDEQLIAYAGRIAAVTDAFAGSLRIEASLPSANDARLDFGAFLALQNLSPFVVSANDATVQTDLNVLWQNTHGDLYLAWASDRQAALRGDDQHEYTFSEQWLADRHAMLTAVTDSHVRDLGASDTLVPNPATGIRAAHYTDLSSGTTINVGLNLSSTAKVIFGTEGDDASGDLSGGQGGDRLYGGAGNDRLDGLGGADHLEGGAGNDTLSGGAGHDHLLGGSGLDTYVLDGSAGHDVLIDEDGGVIRYLDRVLTGGQETSPGSGEWQDGSVRYHPMSDGERQHLLISAGAGTVLVQDWRPGHLGIELRDAPAAPPQPNADLVLHGDRAPFDHDPEADGVQSRIDALGNLIVKPDQIEADRVDTLYDGTGNDQLFGHGGNDTLNAWRGGDDLLDGGAGSDLLRAWAGSDQLIGGDGLDRLFGQDGNDRLYADVTQSDAQVIAAHAPDTEDTQGIAEQGELLVGGSGDDWQVGHLRADLLLGGAGRDQLSGGAQVNGAEHIAALALA